MTTYKGTEKDISCRGYHFTLGKTAKTKGAVRCAKGFHSCTQPLAVLMYYPPFGKRYFKCTASGVIDAKPEQDCKIASEEITLDEEIKLEDLINEQIKGMKEHPNENITINEKGIVSQEDYKGHIASHRHRDNLVLMGSYSSAVSTGVDSTVIGLKPGDYCFSMEEGSTATTFDRASLAVTKREYSKAIVIGDNSTAIAEGDYSIAISAGRYVNAASVEGRNSIAIAVGRESFAKGELGDLLTLYRYAPNEEGVLVPVDGMVVKVDGEKILPNVWYYIDEEGNLQRDD